MTAITFKIRSREKVIDKQMNRNLPLQRNNFKATHKTTPTIIVKG